MEGVSQAFIDALSAFLAARPDRSPHHKQCCFTPCPERGLDSKHHFGFCRLRPHIQKILDRFASNDVRFNFPHYINDLRNRMEGYTCHYCKPKLERLFQSNKAMQRQRPYTAHQDSSLDAYSTIRREDSSDELPLHPGDNDLPALRSSRNHLQTNASQNQHCFTTPVRRRSSYRSSSPVDSVFDTEDTSEANTPGTEVDLDESFKQRDSHVLDTDKSSCDADASSIPPHSDSDDDEWESDGPSHTEADNIRRIPPYRPYSEQTLTPVRQDSCAAYIAELEKKLNAGDQAPGMIYLGYDNQDPGLKHRFIKIGYTKTTVKERYEKEQCDRNMNMLFYSPFGGERYRGAFQLERILKLLFQTKRYCINDCVFCRGKTIAHNEWYEVDTREVMQMIYLFKNLIDAGLLYDANGRITSDFRSLLQDFVDPQRFIRHFINFGLQAASLQPIGKSYTRAILCNAKQIEYPDKSRKVKLAMERAEAGAKTRRQCSARLFSKPGESRANQTSFPLIKRGERSTRRLFTNKSAELGEVKGKAMSDKLNTTKELAGDTTASKVRTTRSG